jgi:hypothetical protein
VCRYGIRYTFSHYHGLAADPRGIKETTPVSNDDVRDIQRFAIRIMAGAALEAIDVPGSAEERLDHLRAMLGRVMECSGDVEVH